jgi:hypothetical protein
MIASSALILIGAGAYLFTSVYEPMFGSPFLGLKWTVWSNTYKKQVLEQKIQPGKLKHIEWNGWGWAGQDTTVFLVYDPADALSAAAQGGRPGKYPGLPCGVYRVHRLESQWYTVQFYTGTYWNYCP